MINKFLCSALCFLLLATANASVVFAQTNTNNDNSAVAKTKAKVKKLWDKEEDKIKLNLVNGTKLSGAVKKVDEDSFDFKDIESQQITTVAYTDVARIKGSGLSTGAKIGLFAGVGVAVAIVVAVLAKSYCNEQAC